MTENTELLARGYRAMTDGDVATVLAMIDPSITIWQTEDLPWGGHYEGIDGFAAFFGKLREAITSQVEVEQIFEAGIHVVQVGRTRGTVNATGVEFDVAEAHIWEIRNGKAVDFRSHIDTPAMVAALRA
jgi:ketosteroid isomerase-like protein